MRWLSVWVLVPCALACSSSRSTNGGGGGAHATGDSGTGGELGSKGGSSSGGASNGGSGGSRNPSSGGRPSSSSGGSSTAGSSAGGSSAGSSAGGSSDGGSTSGDSGNGSGLLDPASTTSWHPGIANDGQLGAPLGDDGLPVRTMVCATLKPGDDVNAAIAACPDGQVVLLKAGKYTVSSTITLKKGVVLRGEGATDGGTVLVKTGGGSVVQIGDAEDGACYQSAYAAADALAADAVKETSVVHVGSAAGHYAKGDLALLDEVDDAAVQEGDCQYFKRVDKRSTSERVEVGSVDAAAGTVTLTSPIHWTFRAGAPHSGQISRLNQPVTRWAGVEDLALQGGSNPGYDGQMAGGIDVSNAAYSWVKNVRTDQTIGGMHVSLTGTFRVVVRDSYFHDSANYGFGTDCYGVVLRCGAADNLVENNIVRYMNKPILFNVSGGGNVVGYNYADNSWATPPAWQEVNIDTHCSFPHMELIEGNYAPHMGATTTHGNAGYLTFFRNYSSSQFAAPPVAGSPASQTGNVAALQFMDGDTSMTALGNVFGSSKATDLGTAPLSNAYTGSDSDVATIISVNTGDVSFKSLWWQANYDTVQGGVRYNPAVPTRTLPPSLYLRSKPAWWPANVVFPWTGSDLSPMVGTLPAKARSDAM